MVKECVELLDNHMMEAINHSGMSSHTYPTKDSLFFKFQGSDASISETNKIVKQVVKRHGATHFNAARNQDEAEELWNHRKVALWSSLAWPDDPDTKIWTTDVCVPPSRLPQLVGDTKKDLEESNIKSTIVGHVGDGRLSLNVPSQVGLNHAQAISMRSCSLRMTKSWRELGVLFIGWCIEL